MHALKEFRLKQPIPLRQSDIAQRLGLTIVQISRWENGRSRVPAERAVMLEKEFGIPREALRPDIFATG